jgi:hypothetical protein
MKNPFSKVDLDFKMLRILTADSINKSSAKEVILVPHRRSKIINMSNSL